MTAQDWHLGIDLGTSNSTAALFDGEQVTLVRNAQGSALTPSVVRVDARGAVSVGAKARRFADADPENTRGEFKRLMGTEQEIRFPASGQVWTPVRLAAEVLRALRADVLEQVGIDATQAVVSVPALFELPQSAATTEAAQLAGFTRVELIQEPVASALAAGWRAGEDEGRWLVYDLGGGTFDASLLESADGFLRVVGHDGDNFLGGRDIDNAIVDWALLEVERLAGVHLSRSDPGHAPALRTIKLAAEEAKIELSRLREAALVVTLADLPQPLDLTLDRARLEALAAPILERSLTVCERLLASHGMAGDDGPRLQRIVLVGGPTAMPAIRRGVAERLGAPLSDRLDAMTLVAQGAAIFAASSGMPAVPAPPLPAAKHRVWLQFPTVSSDLAPHVLGRIMPAEEADGPPPTALGLVRDDGKFRTHINPDGEGVFVAQVELQPRRANVFQVQAWAADGSPVAVAPRSLTILHGLTITDPPLSRTIGVALADDYVEECFVRGTPLPARRTLVRRTVEAMAPRQEAALRIPIVQGEFDRAHLCRLVGAIEIAGAQLRGFLPSGSEVEITLEVDRGGRLAARAAIPFLEQEFSHVAHLVVPEADAETLKASAAGIRERLEKLRGTAFGAGDSRLLVQLSCADEMLASLTRDADAALGGDADASQKARRTLLELEAVLAAGEDTRSWPVLEGEARDAFAKATSWVAELGDAVEQRYLSEAGKALAAALERREAAEVSRQLRLIRRLELAAYYRHPEAWRWELDAAVGRVAEASDGAAARQLAEEGRQATARHDQATLRHVVERLRALLPPDPKRRRLGHDSGIR